MNKLTDGTRYRYCDRGLVAVRGKRELHLLGTSATHTAKARHMLATHSFNALYQAAHQAPGMKNVRYLKV